MIKKLIHNLYWWFIRREKAKEDRLKLKLKDLSDGDIIAFGDPQYSTKPQVYELKEVNGLLHYRAAKMDIELDQSLLDDCYAEKLKWTR